MGNYRYSAYIVSCGDQIVSIKEYPCLSQESGRSVHVFGMFLLVSATGEELFGFRFWTDICKQSFTCLYVGLNIRQKRYIFTTRVNIQDFDTIVSMIVSHFCNKYAVFFIKP